MKVILDTCVHLNHRENLLVFDLSLGMETDMNGDCSVDGESLFLKNFIVNKELLKVPVVESMLKMKWYAMRRILFCDLLLYMIFIIGMTVIICNATSPKFEEKTSAVWLFSQGC